MVHFISFFVGLVVGVQPVELSVSGPVARVEIRIDSETVATMHGSPWKTRIDLGPRPRPAVINAVAFDADGTELGRDVQWVNVPRPRAEVDLLPELDENRALRSVVLRWTSAEFVEPRKTRLTLDGRRVKADSHGRIDLSDLEQERVHLLEAELAFPDNVVVRDQLVFGKGSAGTVNLDMTAVPVWVDRDKRTLRAEDLAGMFRVKGRPVGVADVEHGRAQLVVVRGPSVNSQIDDLARRLQSRKPEGRDDRLPKDVSVRVIGPIPNRGPRGNARLFPVSPAREVGRKGLAADLEGARFADLEFGLPLVADAVALAALRAASGNQRRAVALMLGDEPDDVSSYTAAQVRAFLRDLGVPLVVFDMTRGAEAAEAWRPTEDVSDERRWLSAVRWLREDLENQRIVWLVGKHLLRDVELAPNAEGIDLVR